MADSKISALPAVVTPTDTDEYAVNQGGISKKITRAQIFTNPVHSSYDDQTAIADPAAPGANTLRSYAKSIAGKILPKFIGPAGIDTAIQPALFQNRVILWTPGTGTAPLYSGQTATLGATASHPTPATTSFGQSLSRARFATSTTAGNASGLRSPIGTAYAGNATVRGGYFFNARFLNGSLHTNGVQKMCGMSSSTSLLAGEPSSSMADFIGMCLDSTDTNWQFSRRTGAGAATKINLGVAAAADQVFELTMFMAPSGTTLFVRILQFGAAGAPTVLLDTSFNTVLPAVTTALGLHIQVRNGALAAAHNIEMSRIYLESDY